MTSAQVPDDFPRDVTIPVVPGYQPKIGARRVDGKYIVGYTNEELQERYDECVRMAGQLATYCRKKATENGWTLLLTIERVEPAVWRKVKSHEWVFSVAECEWMLALMRRLLDEVV
ncbi:hypothetical protein [Pandoraea sp. NPDC090278]|uniref:hypothetical protein n=1 Tax=Pandoraea sp. NPDC090278 TaxID=3364391 RepID=UPI00383ADE38